MRSCGARRPFRALGATRHERYEAPGLLAAPAGVTKRIPALVVSGFLGSGKTTLVRRVLDDAQQGGVRAALISNEFGELGIDKALLGRMRDDYVELRGGCVCCRLSDQLVDTLQMLRERADPDRIVIETSGVALPYDTQLNFWREPVAGWIEDDVAVVVVNAEQLAQGRDLESTFEQQVSSADLLLLNKIDLVADLCPLLGRMRGVLAEVGEDLEGPEEGVPRVPMWGPDGGPEPSLGS